MRKIVVSFFTLIIFLSFNCNTGSEGYEMRGRIYNRVTGEGIPDACVAVGRNIVHANSNGYYFFVSGSPILTGLVGAWKNGEYGFKLIYDAKIDLSAKSVYDFSIPPSDTSGYDKITISGTLPKANSTNGGRLTIETQTSRNGSYSSTVAIEPDSTSYSTEVVKGDADSLIIVKYNPDYTDWINVINRYYSHRDLRSDCILDISDSGAIPVTVRGEEGIWFASTLCPRGYSRSSLYVPSTDMPETGFRIVDVFNPDDMPMAWYTLNSTYGAYSIGRISFADTMNPCPEVTLPLKVDPVHDPAGPVDASTTTFDDATGTVSFGSITGATYYLLIMTDNTGNRGTICVKGNTFVFPPDFVKNVILKGEGWDCMYYSAWNSPGDYEQATLFTDRAYQGIQVSGGNNTIVDFIQ